jgi:phosphate uptake regulator
MSGAQASLMAELFTGGTTLPVTIELTLVAHFYERIGDHAASILRQTVYLYGFLDWPASSRLSPASKR